VRLRKLPGHRRALPRAGDRARSQAPRGDAPAHPAAHARQGDVRPGHAAGGDGRLRPARGGIGARADHGLSVLRALRGCEAQGEVMRTVSWMIFVALALGCASASSPPGTVVPVADVRSVSGRWTGTMIDEHNMGAPLEVFIGPGATYRMRFADVTAFGTVTLAPDGKLAFTMTGGTGLLGPLSAASTAALYDRGGKRVLVGSGRIGLRQHPFSWEATEQR